MRLIDGDRLYDLAETSIETTSAFQNLIEDQQTVDAVPKSVLQDIKAEIDELDFDFGDFYDHTKTIHNMIDEVWDKHISGEEQQGENT